MVLIYGLLLYCVTTIKVIATADKIWYQPAYLMASYFGIKF